MGQFGGTRGHTWHCVCLLVGRHNPRWKSVKQMGVDKRRDPLSLSLSLNGFMSLILWDHNHQLILFLETKELIYPMKEKECWGTRSSLINSVILSYHRRIEKRQIWKRNTYTWKSWKGNVCIIEPTLTDNK